MNGYIRFIEHNRRLLLVVFAAVTLLAIVGVVQLQINANMDIFRVKDSQYQQVLERMEVLFGTSDQIIVLIETDARGLSAEAVGELRRAQSFMEELSGVETVQGPAPEEISFGFQKINLTGDLSDRDMQFLREHYEGMGKLSTLVEHDGRLNGVFTIYPGGDFDHGGLAELEAFLREEGYHYSITGDLFMQQKIVDYIRRILFFLPPVALLLVLLVFRSQMGSMKATIFSILPAGVAALWTLGVAGWLGDPVSIITVLAPIFTIVIGSADGLHFVSHVQDSRSEGKGTAESLVSTLRMVGVPMIITTVTSMAGFLSLLVMNTAAIRDLAVFASLGIFLAGVASWYVLPVILAGGTRLGGSNVAAGDGSSGGPPHGGQSGAGRLGRPDVTAGDRSSPAGVYPRGPLRFLPRLWGRPSVAAALILIAFGVVGLQFLSTQFSQLAIFRQRTDVHKSFERIMEVNNGSIPVYLLIESREDILAPDRGLRILRFEEELGAAPEVGKVVSAYDALALINAGMFGGSGGGAVYPESRRVVEAIWSLISGQGNRVSHLINRDAGAARLIVFPRDLQNETLDVIASKAEDFDDVHEDLEITVTGGQYLMRELNRNMLDNQGKTILLAFGIIFLLLLISLRAFLPALVSLLPIAATTLVIFGFMGIAGIPLSLFTATMFSITIGIGIDYAVHFTSVWKRFTGDGMDPATAADHALKYTGRPIVANAFGLAIGLSALMLSPLMIHLYMSALMWVAMLTSVFLSLSFLPTVLRKVGKR